jgi:hypothetical protein
MRYFVRLARLTSSVGVTWPLCKYATLEYNHAVPFTDDEVVASVKSHLEVR